MPSFAVGDPDRFGDGLSHVCSSKPDPDKPLFHIFCFFADRIEELTEIRRAFIPGECGEDDAVPARAFPP